MVRDKRGIYTGIISMKMRCLYQILYRQQFDPFYAKTTLFRNVPIPEICTSI